MKFGTVLPFAFLFTLLLFTYGVEARRNKDNKERDRRRQDRNILWDIRLREIYSARGFDSLLDNTVEKNLVTLPEDLEQLGCEPSKERPREATRRRDTCLEDKRREKNTLREIDNNPTILAEPTFPVPTVSPLDRNVEVFGDVLGTTKRPRRHHHKQRGRDKGEKAKKHKTDRERRREKGTGQVAEPEIVSFDDMLTIGKEDPTDPAPAPAPTSKVDKMTDKITVSMVSSANVTNLLLPTEITGEIAKEIQMTTEQNVEESTPTRTPQAEDTQTERRRGREGKKDKQNRNKRRNETEQGNRLDEEMEEMEVEPTELAFSTTIQPQQPQTTTLEPSRDGRRKNRDERKKDKREKKKSKSIKAPVDNGDEISEEIINDLIPSPEPETQTDVTETRDQINPKIKQIINQEEQALHEELEADSNTKKKNTNQRNRDSNWDRREGGERQEKGTKRDRRLKGRVRLHKLDSTKNLTLGECKSDRECTQGSCCEIHKESKVCREYSHQEGQKCRDHCACHTGLICQSPDPTRRYQRTKRQGPSRCRVPGVNGMGDDFVGIVQDALEDVMETIKKKDRSN